MRNAQCWWRLRLREIISIYLTTLLIIVGILVLSFNPIHPISPRDDPFPYRVPLDPQGVAELAWNVSYPQETVYFCLLIRQLKFGMLFGMSDRGDIRNADLAVLWSDGQNSYFGVSLCWNSESQTTKGWEDLWSLCPCRLYQVSL